MPMTIVYLGKNAMTEQDTSPAPKGVTCLMGFGVLIEPRGLLDDKFRKRLLVCFVSEQSGTNANAKSGPRSDCVSQHPCRAKF